MPEQPILSPVYSQPNWPIQPADLICTHGSSLLSHIITDFTGMISHIGLVTPSLQVIQALDTVRVLSLEETLAKANYAYVCQLDTLTNLERSRICTHAAGRMGTPYAYRNLLLQALDAVFRTSWWTERYGLEDMVICSELVADAYASVGVPLGNEVDVTPSSIFHVALGDIRWHIRSLPCP